MEFELATREKAKLKMALIGGPKDGKSFTGLKLLRALVGPQGRIAAIDTENGSLSKYADPTEQNGFRFNEIKLTEHHPKNFIDLIYKAVKDGYDAILIDSMSHEWIGKGGCLEWKETITKQSKNANDFTGWADVTPVHNDVFRVINAAPIHVIATFRQKTEYVMEEYTKGNGQKGTRPRKVGLAPVTRDGSEFEFDIVMFMEEGVGRIDHTARCSDLHHTLIEHPGAELAATIKNWLEEGNAPAEKQEVIQGPNGSISTKTTPQQTANTGVTPSTGGTGNVQPTGGAVPSDPKPQASAQSSASEAAKTGAATDSNPKPQASSAGAGNAAPDITFATGMPHADPDAKVGPTEMGQMLHVGTQNGWSRGQISDFVCFAFGLTPQTFSLSAKQWDTAVKLLMRKENCNGQVKVTADGRPLLSNQIWPQPSTQAAG